MQKIKNFLALVALVCALIAVGLSVFSVLSLQEATDRVAALEQRNAFLQEQVNTLAAFQNSVSSDAYCHLMVNQWSSDLTNLGNGTGDLQAHPIGAALGRRIVAFTLHQVSAV